jgi:hypothetical protein
MVKPVIDRTLNGCTTDVMLKCETLHAVTIKKP